MWKLAYFCQEDMLQKFHTSREDRWGGYNASRITGVRPLPTHHPLPAVHFTFTLMHVHSLAHRNTHAQKISLNKSSQQVVQIETHMILEDHLLTFSSVPFKTPRQTARCENTLCCMMSTVMVSSSNTISLVVVYVLFYYLSCSYCLWWVLVLLVLKWNLFIVVALQWHINPAALYNAYIFYFIWERPATEVSNPRDGTLSSEIRMLSQSRK